MLKNSNRGFLKMGILSIIAVYFLILVGSIVRSTGSGMGCPDWPKCFGNIVPPTNKSQLPPDYKKIYTEKRLSKNKRIAQMLSLLGFKSTSERILSDPNILTETDFDPVKTWIEYLNRLVGVTVGILIILLVIYSIPFLKSDPIIFYLSLLSLVLVGFEGWLGSIVVSTNLLPFMVTLHMGLALIIVLLVLYVIFRSQRSAFNFDIDVSNSLRVGLICLMALTFIQILIGTRVRENVDLISMNLEYTHRDLWISYLSGIFKVHRSLSILLLLLHLGIAYNLLKNVSVKLIKSLSIGLIAVFIVLIASGIILNYLGFPAWVQPVHLLLASLLIGIQYILYLSLKYSKVSKAY